MPMYVLRGKAVISNMVSNVLVGMSSYTVCENRSTVYEETGTDRISSSL